MIPFIATARKFIRRFAPKTDLRELKRIASTRQAQRLRARYDAAQTNADNRKHWINADDLSARAANSLSVRKTLRRNSRYEAANNSYAAGMLLTLSNDIVGSGPRLQMQTPDPVFNQLVEQEFSAWQRDVRFAQKLRTKCLAKPRDGEAFSRMFTNMNHNTPVSLDFELLECDQVTTPILKPERNHVDGIWFDAYNRPEFYDVLDQHPGDMDYMPKNPEPRKIPAKDVIHWFREDRPGQKRGVPEITPALPLFAQLRRYTLAVIAAAETAADFAAIISSQAEPNEGEDVAEPFSEIEISQRMLLTLPNKMTLEQLKAEQPTTTYGEFKREIINEIARCMNMPFNVAAGNSAGYNYSSGRLDHQIYFRSIGITQCDCEDIVLDRLFRAWYQEAQLLRLVKPIDMRRRCWSWSWDPAEDLDPEKSSRARLAALQFGGLSYQRMYGELGLDWQVEQKQQAEALGLDVDSYRKLLIQKLYGEAGSITNPAGVDPLAAIDARRRAVKRRVAL